MCLTLRPLQLGMDANLRNAPLGRTRGQEQTTKTCYQNNL